MKTYKVGDRIFYECFNGSIETAIVIKIRKESYIDDNGKNIPYSWLIIYETENGRFSTGIEDYNCLSINNPKCKELAAKYKKFDKKKDTIINSILTIMSPWEKNIQSEIINLLKLKLNI